MANTFLTLALPPILIAAALYLLITYAIHPLLARYRRYAPYTPVSLSHSQPRSHSSLLARLPRWLERYTPAARGAGARLHAWATRDRSGSGSGSQWSEFDDDQVVAEEGERMVGFDARVGAVGREREREREQDEEEASDRRLSRELEEGFRDDSDGEEEVMLGRRMSVSVEQ